MAIRVDEQVWSDYEQSEGESVLRFLASGPIHETMQLVRDVGCEMVQGRPWERTSEFAPDIYEFRTADPCPGGAELVIETAYLRPFLKEFVRRLELRGWSGEVAGPMQAPSRQRISEGRYVSAFYQTLDADACRNACAAVATWLTDHSDTLDYYTNSLAPCEASELLELVDIAQGRAVTFTVYAHTTETTTRWSHGNEQHPRASGHINFSTTASLTELEPRLKKLVASVGRYSPFAGVLPPTQHDSGLATTIPPSYVLAPLPMQAMDAELATRFADDPRWEVKPLSETTALVTNQEHSMFDVVDVTTPGFEQFDDIVVWGDSASLRGSGYHGRVPPDIGRMPMDPMPTQFTS